MGIVELFLLALFLFSVVSTGIYLLIMIWYVVVEKARVNKEGGQMNVDWSVVIIHTSLIVLYYLCILAVYVKVVLL